MRKTIIVKSNIIEKLNIEIAKIKTKSARGVTMALLAVKRDAIKLTPVDTGNLRASCYTQTFRTMKGPSGEIGYTAYYATYVHETNKNYKAKGTSWKFLEKAVKRNRKKILKIIKNEAYIR